MPKMNMRRRTLVIAQLALVAGACVWLLQVIWSNRTQLADYDWQINSWLLALSIGIWVASTLLWARIWRDIVVCCGQPVSTHQGVDIYVLTGLAKYLPGSIWNYIGRGVLAKRRGLSPGRIWLATVFEIMLALSVGLTLAIAYLWSVSSNSLGPLAHLSLILGWSAVTLPLHPRVFARLARFLSRALGRGAISVELSIAQVLKFWLAAFVVWLWIGLAFFLFVNSLAVLDRGTLMNLVVAWSSAAALSLVAVLFPQGLGIKEGVLVLFLVVLMPPGIAGVVSLASRIWTVVCDLATVVCWLGVKRVLSRYSNSSDSSLSPQRVIASKE